MTLSDEGRAYRKNGKLVIEIPENLIVAEVGTEEIPFVEAFRRHEKSRRLRHRHCDRFQERNPTRSLRPYFWWLKRAIGYRAW